MFAFTIVSATGLPRLGRLALDELLADHRLKPDLALSVLAEVLESLVGDLHHHRRAQVLVHVERIDDADLGARDLHVLAGDQELGVVEDRADLVVAAAVVVTGTEREDDRGDERDCGSGYRDPLSPGA